MVRFGYTIAYVDDVIASVEFFERAFGMNRKFIDDSGDYGELDTGTTTLAFAKHSLGAANLPDGYINGTTSELPLGIEVALISDDVAATHQAALAEGAQEIKAPQQKPWGQIVSYVRTPAGILLEIGSEM